MVEARVLPQLGGQLNAALLVRGDLDGGGVEHTADLAALDEALFLNFGGDLFELLRREGGQAVIQPPGYDEGLPHRVPEAGGEVQTPFCVDCVIILTDEHPAPLPSSYCTNLRQDFLRRCVQFVNNSVENVENCPFFPTLVVIYTTITHLW